MTFLRNLWRRFDRRIERALAPEFVAREVTLHPRANLPTLHPGGHLFMPPPRR